MHWPAQLGVFIENAAGVPALHEDEVGGQDVAGIRVQLVKKPAHSLL